MNKRLRLGLFALYLCNGAKTLASDSLVVTDCTDVTSSNSEKEICFQDFSPTACQSRYKLDVDKANRYGFTDLMHAVIQGNAASIRWLLDHGACVNRVNRAGATPIMLAVQNIDNDNYGFKKRMLFNLLRTSPSLDSVKNPGCEKSPKQVLALLRAPFSGGTGIGADMLEYVITKIERSNKKQISFCSADFSRV